MLFPCCFSSTFRLKKKERRKKRYGHLAGTQFATHLNLQELKHLDSCGNSQWACTARSKKEKRTQAYCNCRHKRILRNEKKREREEKKRRERLTNWITARRNRQWITIDVKWVSLCLLVRELDSKFYFTCLCTCRCYFTFFVLNFHGGRVCWGLISSQRANFWLPKPTGQWLRRTMMMVRMMMRQVAPLAARLDFNFFFFFFFSSRTRSSL